METVWRGLRILALTMAAWSGAALAAPQVGWWWNPDESGRGFFIESQGGIFYLAGYFYGADGRSTWLVAGGANADPYSFDGRLLAYAGGQTLFGPYQPPGAPLDSGAISVRFADDTHATLTWPGGTVVLQRHVYGGDDPAFQPLNGWWWNPAESGRGYSIELQGDKMFVASFMYDGGGLPVWYISAGPMTSPMRYEGPWLSFANGQTLGGPYRPPDTPQTVGRVAIDFTLPDKATMTFSSNASASALDRSAQPQQSAPVQIPIEREFRPEIEIRDRYGVRWTYVAEYASPGTGTHVKYTIRGVVNFVALDELPSLPGSGPQLEASIDFAPVFDADSTVVSIDYVSTVTTPLLTCNSIGSKSAALPVNGNYKLEVSKFGMYKGTISVPKISFPITGTCQAAGAGTFPLNDTDDGLVVIIDLLGEIISHGAGAASGHGAREIGVGALHTWRWTVY